MDLGRLLHLESHGPDTYVGVGPQYPWGGLYGGQIVAQALRAAAATVEDDMTVHSLRAYFIRRGDNTEPVRYEVDRIRNGRSFCTRRVVARQAVGAILNLEASFQRAEQTADVTTVHMQPGLPSPESLESSAWTDSFERRSLPAGALVGGRTSTGRIGAWMRVNEQVDDDDLLHRCWLAYLSDDLPTDSVRAALAEHQPGTADQANWWDHVFAASLDHAVWFHRPVRADQWHLYDVSCYGYTGGRGLATGHVFAADGTHVATIAQEVLLRPGR
ncbi:MAG: tesB [Ilumatobacteraceae bacterium]|nr:tesB [Ilumatobacteraceae bacterium]